MSRRTLIILLIISLAFNLAVLGMFSFVALFHRSPFPPPHFGKPGDGCPVDNPPKAERQGHWKQGFNPEKIKPFHENFRSRKLEFLESVGKENFSEAEANQALQKSLAAHHELEQALGKNLIEMRKKMTPEEAKTFIRGVRNRHINRNDLPERGERFRRGMHKGFRPENE